MGVEVGLGWTSVPGPVLARQARQVRRAPSLTSLTTRFEVLDSRTVSARMASTLKVAIIQLYPEPLEIDRNFHKAKSLIQSAASQGAELAVLPEYHLSGWAPDLPGWRELGDRSQEFLDKYCVLAREEKICIVPGTIVRPDLNNELRNHAYFIDSSGQVVGQYIKKNLW
jgi:predicted amidohydrolase